MDNFHHQKSKISEYKSFKQQTLQIYILKDHLSMATLTTNMCQICFFPKILLKINYHLKAKANDFLVPKLATLHNVIAYI